MKKIILSLPLLATVVLSGCTFLDDDSWKEEYGTPILLLDNSSDRYVYRDHYDASNNDYMDEDLTIANAVKSCAPFEEVDEGKSKSSRCFTYESFWMPATSGPNYCYMETYDNGLIIICHKRSLGKEQFCYFSISEEKATLLVDYVYSLVSEN